MALLDNNVPVRVIESDNDYELALEQMADLMSRTPPAGSDSERLLKTLAVLVRDFESRQYSIAPPDPIEAIQFRMEQQGLAPKDLVPFLGSRSRVSEVLGGKRPLTLPMIRNLHLGLGIPASSLLGGRGKEGSEVGLDLRRVPFSDMKKRGWIDRLPRNPADATQLFESWLAPVRSQELAPLYRRHVRSAKTIDHEKLIVWTAQVAKRALSHSPSGKFDSTWSPEFLRDVARLSVFKNGPALVRELLDQHGIVLIVEPSLSSWLDGAAMMFRQIPIIALTLRHDRLDNFWFVVMHELVHLFKHLESESTSYFDDLDFDSQTDPKEVEADALASEILIPADVWKTSPASRLRSADAANHLAQRLRIHPAIVAGRIRRTYKDYRVLSGLVGQGEVRKHFEEWQE